MELAELLEQLDRGDGPMALETTEVPHGEQPTPAGHDDFKWNRDFKRHRRLYDDSHAPLNDLPIDVREAQAALKEQSTASASIGATHKCSIAPATKESVSSEMLRNQEIAWRDNSEADKPLDAKATAERKGEWQKFGSVELLMPTEPQAVREKSHKDRRLPSRFVYPDENANMRSEQLSLPIKAKACAAAGNETPTSLRDS